MKYRVVEELKRRQELNGQRAAQLNVWARGNTTGPFKITYFPTNCCNLKCAICWQRQGVPDYSELSVLRQKQLIDEAFLLGVKEFVIGGGGEPLLKWKALKPLLKQIKDYKMYGLLFTNGTLISPEIASFLVEINWDKVLISVDGSTEVTNDLIRGKGSFKALITGFDNLLLARCGASKPLIGFGSVLTRQGIYEISTLTKMLGEKDGDQMNLIRLVAYKPSQRRFALKNGDLSGLTNILKESLDIADCFGIATNFKDYLDPNIIRNSETFNKILLGNSTKVQENFPFWDALCFEPFTNMVIYADGMVGPCCMSGDSPVTSIKDQTLADIWFGTEFTRLREGIINRKPESYCHICDNNVFQDNQRLREIGSAL